MKKTFESYEKYLEFVEYTNLYVYYYGDLIMKNHMNSLNQSIKTHYDNNSTVEYEINDDSVYIYPTEHSKLGSFLHHTSYFYNLTDDDCVELARGEVGVDAQQALLNICERDFCKSYCDEVTNSLKNYINEKPNN